VESFGSQHLLYPGISQYCRKGGVSFHSGKLFVAFVLGFPKIDHAPLNVSCFRKRLGEQEIKSSAVTHGTILQNRAVPRAVVLKKLRIQRQRLAERRNSFLIFFVAEIGISKVA